VSCFTSTHYSRSDTPAYQVGRCPWIALEHHPPDRETRALSKVVIGSGQLTIRQPDAPSPSSDPTRISALRLVATGQVLADLIDSTRVPVARLTEIPRVEYLQFLVLPDLRSIFADLPFDRTVVCHLVHFPVNFGQVFRFSARASTVPIFCPRLIR